MIKRIFSKKMLPIVLLLTITVLVSFSLGYYQESSSVKAQNIEEKNLIIFTKEELKRYNGTDPNLPIYLAMDGLVYDVTQGREFYQEGGSYHFLAGRDSGLELRLVGGDIIKRKYTVIGKLKD